MNDTKIIQLIEKNNLNELSNLKKFIRVWMNMVGNLFMLKEFVGLLI